MKIRESGMPERGMWEQFFDAPRILGTLGLTRTTQDAVEFGCGYGTFTLPAARIVSGMVFALDIEAEMIQATQAEAARQGIGNIRAQLCDFMAQGTGLRDRSMDFAMLFNILHLEHPDVLLREAWRVLKPGKTLGIIHWNHDPSTPRGPSLEIRPKPGDCIEWAESAGFVAPKIHDLQPYHYGISVTRG